MNPLHASNLGIEIDEVLAVSHNVPSIFSAHDHDGRCYLVVQAGSDHHSVTWLCAPVTPLALRCVSEGRADPRDAVRHSATGAVERLTVSTEQADGVEESVTLCRELRDDDLDAVPNARVIASVAQYVA